ncbi:hypothetical protein AVEN_133231-1 [Araneus ventricosus]|uniref:RNase H type-1 domain-containing protein n=1 Tax=Araneus ventricosus TaxID=182803 RepID=A0A4Y2J6H7_ARAVE|nr:hypothetical protein AVEN_133231-1 [Araneus ventricosus]
MWKGETSNRSQSPNIKQINDILNSMKYEPNNEKKSLFKSNDFRSELIAIDEGLDKLSSFYCSINIWILTDSRHSIQHFANWHRVRDNIGMNILNKLRSLSVSYRIHLQWIPSHVIIRGNESADDALAKAGAVASVPSAPLTYL